jgi:hypothetical protein
VASVFAMNNSSGSASLSQHNSPRFTKEDISAYCRPEEMFTSQVVISDVFR